MGNIPRGCLAQTQKANLWKCQKGYKNPEERSVGCKCGPETLSKSSGPGLPPPGRTDGRPRVLLTLMRSFSFCHFSASSSISMILSCSCSFCSDSSVYREGAGVGGEVRGSGKNPESQGGGPTNHHSALHSTNTHWALENARHCASHQGSRNKSSATSL